MTHDNIKNELVGYTRYWITRPIKDKYSPTLARIIIVKSETNGWWKDKLRYLRDRFIRRWIPINKNLSDPVEVRKFLEGVGLEPNSLRITDLRPDKELR